jgi:UDP-N-acetylmuramate dehydrogenase
MRGTLVTAQERIAEIAADHGVALERDVSLARYTFFGVGGPMRALLRPSRVDPLPGLLRDLAAEGLTPRLLGCGTNLVAGDAPFPEPILYLCDLAGEPAFESDRVSVHAGFRLPALVRRAMHRGLGGIEFAEGIPGTVGAALAINAGSYGGSIGDHVESFRLVGFDGTVREVRPRPSDFAYRGSAFVERGLILDAVIRLRPEGEAAVRERLDAIRARRRASQPLKERSAGCIFKNPPEESAGRLIDRLGFKGRRRGGAVVSEVHANFIVNRGGATAADIVALTEEIKEAVLRSHGILLEEEVAIWLPSKERE